MAPRQLLTRIVRTFPLGVRQARGRARTVPTGGGRSIPPISSVITSDRFTGGDVADINGRTTDNGLGGSNRTWSSAVAELGISSGNFARTSGTTTRRAGFDAGSGDVYVTVVARANAGVFAGTFVQIRRTDVTTTSMDHYRVNVGSSGTVSLQKVVGGVTTNLSPTYAIAADTKVGIYAVGSKIGMTVADVSVWEVDDTDVASSRTFFAFQVQTSNNGLLDDLVINQL